MNALKQHMTPHRTSVCTGVDVVDEETAGASEKARGEGDSVRGWMFGNEEGMNGWINQFHSISLFFGLDNTKNVTWSIRQMIMGKERGEL